ncbi:MAG TPA: TAXI family TRAP transporter solute-binding subunit [Rhizomicrobium sp.]|nr:TAXI family TRAP transporter solute-binding subunit [Rhizomicrobium sp.]
MKRRRVTWLMLGGLVVPLAGVLLLLVAGLNSAQALPQRISFQILTGSTGGTYFPVGQLIAGLISHPPGVDRCESAPVCGPSGLIISARTSEGAVANVLAVNSGRAESGLAQGDVVAEAVAGHGAFRKAGKQGALRVIADLFPEDVHLLVARSAKIASVADLRGKRVSLGAEASGTGVTAKAILAAYGISERRIKARHDPVDVDAQLLQQGQIDAFFMVGGRPVALVDDLVSRGVARIVPIDGKGRDKLIRSVPTITADRIPAGTYRDTPAIPTVSVRALWMVNAQQPASLVYGITRSLFSPGNRAALDAGQRSAGMIRLENATLALPAPLHPGAAQFYREMGRLPKFARP